MHRAAKAADLAALAAADTARGLASGVPCDVARAVAADFLPKFAAAINTMLAGSVEDAANRLDASAQRMGNSWEKLKQTVGDTLGEGGLLR